VRFCGHPQLRLCRPRPCCGQFSDQRGRLPLTASAARRLPPWRRRRWRLRR
jgi:hypothetical protein